MAFKQLKWLIFIGLILVVGRFAVPWSGFTHNLQKSLVAQVRQMSGLDLNINGHVAFELVPHPGIRINDVTLQDRFGAIKMDVPSIRARLRLGPLLLGRLEFDAFKLRRPDIRIDAKKLILTQADLAMAMRQEDRLPDSIGKIHIKFGTISVFGDAPAADTIIRDVTATLDWPRLGAPAAFHGRGRWHDLSGSVSAWIESPKDLMLRGSSNAIVRLHSPIAAASYEGTISTAINPQVLGRISGKIIDLPRLLQNFHVTLPAPDLVQDLDFAGDLHGLQHEISLTNASLQLDSTTYTGSLALITERHKPHLSATLSTNQFVLDLGTNPAPPPVAVQNLSDESKSFVANLFRDMHHTDLDVRLSASTAILGPIKLQDAAISVLSNSDQLEVSLGETQGYGGIVKFKSLFRSSGDHVTAEGSASATNLTIRSLAHDLRRVSAFSGSLTGQMTWQTSGASLEEWLDNIAGTGQISISQGEMDGFDAELALRHLADKSLKSLMESHAGRTSFNRLAAGFELSGQHIHVQDGVVLSPTLSGTFSGDVSLADGTCRINANAHTLPARPSDTQLSLEVTGPWNTPKLRPDAVKF